jgi:hypothetical protein
MPQCPSPRALIYAACATCPLRCSPELCTSRLQSWPHTQCHKPRRLACFSHHSVVVWMPQALCYSKQLTRIRPLVLTQHTLCKQLAWPWHTALFVMTSARVSKVTPAAVVPTAAFLLHFPIFGEQSLHRFASYRNMPKSTRRQWPSVYLRLATVGMYTAGAAGCSRFASARPSQCLIPILHTLPAHLIC